MSLRSKWKSAYRRAERSCEARTPNRLPEPGRARITQHSLPLGQLTQPTKIASELVDQAEQADQAAQAVLMTTMVAAPVLASETVSTDAGIGG